MTEDHLVGKSGPEEQQHANETNSISLYYCRALSQTAAADDGNSMLILLRLCARPGPGAHSLCN